LRKRGSKGRPAAVVVVTPDARINRSARSAISRLGDSECVRMSLERYASARHAPLSIVICPAGADVRDDLAFLEDVRRRLVWPPPSSELWSAIAGLRGSHDPPPAGSTPPRRRTGRRTALLLEGDVTLDRARRAAAAGGPRDWIVERVQRVRVPPGERDDLDGLGVRWAVLEPVDVRAVVASPALFRARARWASWFPRTAEIWAVAGGK
jgi:hypothetical protein